MARIVHSSDCSSCPQRAKTVWCGVAAGELQLINRYKIDRICGPGEVLYHQGASCEGIYCLREGLVGERRVDANGESVLAQLHHPGAIIGYPEFLSRAAFRNTTEILRESHVCFLGRPLVNALLAADSDLGSRFLSKALQDFGDTEDRYVEALTATVRTRFLHTLLVFYEHYGRFVEPDGHLLEIPVGRQELAALIGTTPETISRTIRQLGDEELVRIKGNCAILPNLEAAYREAEAAARAPAGRHRGAWAP